MKRSLKFMPVKKTARRKPVAQAAKSDARAAAKPAAAGPKVSCANRRSFPVVGIGASAGGLEAFTQLLGALPLDTGLAFVLVRSNGGFREVNADVNPRHSAPASRRAAYSCCSAEPCPVPPRARKRFSLSARRVLDADRKPPWILRVMEEPAG